MKDAAPDYKEMKNLMIAKWCTNPFDVLSRNRIDNATDGIENAACQKESEADDREVFK